MRTLIDEYGSTHRSLLIGLNYQMGEADNIETIFVTAATADPIDPSVTRSGGQPITWSWGDGNSSTGDSVTHNYGGAGSYTVTWDALPGSITDIDFQSDFLTSLNTFDTWTNLTTFSCYSNSLTSLDTFDTWTNLTTFSCYSNSLTSLDTFDTWTNLTTFSCYSNSLTSLDTFDTWTNLTTFSCNNNSLTSLDTFDTWTNLTTFSCNNNSLTAVEVHQEWTSISNVRVQSNSLPAAEIDDILTELDASGAINGTLKYENNPGSADIDRSAPAATAKANLIGKGWVITN